MTQDHISQNAASGARPYILKTGDVAEMFHVDAKTVARWASAGRIPSFRTPGGHRRFRRDDVEAVIAASRVERVPDA